MTILKEFIISLAFGGLWLASISYIGAWIAARLRLLSIGIGDSDFRWLMVPAIGISAVSLVTGICLGLGLGIWSGTVIYLWLILVIVDSRTMFGFWRDISVPIAPLVLVISIAIAQYFVITLVQHSPFRGDDIFWSIYGLTYVTPGDSPQGYLQAQYLLHGSREILGLENFSIFDRPFLGGIITASALCAVGQCPKIDFGNPSGFQAELYVSLWIWLNALSALGIWSIVSVFSTVNRRTSVALLIIISPIMVFNGIGLWPKQLALYLLICGALLSVFRYFPIAIILSGIAFFAHGSFLWVHISFSFGILVYLIFVQAEASVSKKRSKVFIVALLSITFPAVWFWSEHYFGGSTPLRAFYLYDAYSVNAALHEPISKLAENFYKSTHVVNLMLLPVINLIKCLLPTELLYEMLDFSYRDSLYSFAEFSRSHFMVSFNRPFFAFGIILGIVGFNCIINYWKNYWVLPVSVVIFFVLPLLPGSAIYRHDDYFLLKIMLFAIIPLVMAIAIAANRLSNNKFMLICFVILLEYVLVYMFRFRLISYDREFVNWYHLAVVILLCVSFGFILWRESNVCVVHKIKLMEKSVLKVFDVEVEIHRVVTIVIILAVMIMPVLPVILLKTLGDGGFDRYGESANLLTWSNVLVKRNGDSYINPNVKISIKGDERDSVWINSGQSVRYRNVKIGHTSHLTVGLGIVPAYYESGGKTPDIHFDILVNYDNRDKLLSRITINPTENNEDKTWREISVDLSEYVGLTSDIVLSVESDQAGIWAVWADPFVSL